MTLIIWSGHTQPWSKIMWKSRLKRLRRNEKNKNWNVKPNKKRMKRLNKKHSQTITYRWKSRFSKPKKWQLTALLSNLPPFLTTTWLQRRRRRMSWIGRLRWRGRSLWRRMLRFRSIRRIWRRRRRRRRSCRRRWVGIWRRLPVGWMGC